MNASLEPTAPTSIASRQACAAAQAASPRTAVVREGILEVPGEVSLYHGGKLAGMRIAWRMAGPANAPVVCALGGISANRRVCLTEDPRQSWWSRDRRARSAPLDSNRFRVLSFDYLGGSAESTGPDAGQPLSEHLQLRPGRSAAAAPQSPRHQVAARDRRRLLRRHGRAGVWRAYPERVGQLDRDRRSRSRASDGDRLAQRPAAHRALRDRLRPRRRTVCSSRARSPCRRTAAPRSSRRASRARRRARTSASCSRSSSICSRAAATMRRATRRSRSCVCRNRSTCIASMPSSIFVPTTAVAVREDQLVPLADIRAMVARLAGRPPARDLVHLRSRCLPEGVGTVAQHIRRRARECGMTQRSTATHARSPRPCVRASSATTRPARSSRRST